MATNYDLSKEIKEFLVEQQTKTKYEYQTLSEKQKAELLKILPMIPEIDEDNVFNSDLSINLKSGKTLKANYNKSSSWLSINGRSQITIPKVLQALGFEFDETRTPKENFLSCLEAIGIHKFLKWICEGMVSTDYLLQIPKNLKNIILYETSQFVWDFNEEDIETDIFEDQEKSTWRVLVDGILLFQIQAPPSIDRPKNQITRINLEGLSKYYHKKIQERNNETFGISAEVALCEINNIEIPDDYNGRWDGDLVEETKMELRKQTFFNEIQEITKILATEREGAKKSSTDFIAGERTISVKTNFGNSTKVCPPDIGQPGMLEGLKYYNSTMDTNFGIEDIADNNYYEFKKKIQENISQIMVDQTRKLFSEDKMLYIRKMKKAQEIYWIDTNEEDLPNFEAEFTFSRSPEDWNESVSIRYEGTPIAEMQIHSKRSPFKFRINMPNLMKILKK